VTDFRKIWFECHVALPSIIPTSELRELFWCRRNSERQVSIQSRKCMP